MYKKYNSIKKQEILAANKVIKTGVLSDFIGQHNPKFLGGKKVREFEEFGKKLFGVKYAISVNSWTSGLICAIGSLQLKPGSEIILPTWTMSACFASIIHWNCIPIFADIDADNQCIDVENIKSKITSNTRAILAVDICGNPCNMPEIRKIANKHNLATILDCAQAPFSEISRGKKSFEYADIWGISFNCHKHIQTGEGGMIFTNKKNLALKMQLIRNHAEAVINKRKLLNNLSNLIGYNFRLGEIEASIGIEQLKKLKKIIKNRIKLCNLLTKKLSKIKGLKLPKIIEGYEHNFYIYPIILDTKLIKIKRSKLINRLIRNGCINISAGYENLHKYRIFRNLKSFQNGYPWKFNPNQKYTYQKGDCPVAENLHDYSYIGLQVSAYDLNSKDIEKIYLSFKNTWNELKI